MDLEKILNNVSEIINLPQPTRKDMVQLSRLEFNLALIARQLSIASLEEEERYNLKKSSVTLEEKWRKRWVTESVEMWKYVAERENWWYRSMKESAKTLWNTIDSIRWFKISVYSAEREMDSAAGNNFKFVQDEWLNY